MFLRITLPACTRLLSVLPSVLVITAILLLVGCASPGIQSSSVTSGFNYIDTSGLEQLYARAQDGSAEAQYELGHRLDTGDGVEMNPVQAIDWLRKAALQKHTDAQFLLGLMYLDGRGVETDRSIGTDWFLEAALQGHGMAQYHLGKAYTTGIGIDRDPGQGVYWLHQAANQDIAIAQHYMGLLLLQGNSTAPDRDKGAELIYRAGAAYLDAGRPGSASAALLDLERETPGHTLVTELSARLVLDKGQSVNREYSWDGNSVGTGWPLRSGYVVTNHHVIAGSREITLINASGKQLVASIVLSDPGHDIAILAVEDSSQLPPALPLARQDTATGTDVFTVGFPRIDIFGSTPKLTSGKVLAEHGQHGDHNSYKLNLQIYQGNSGGPLINMNGEVVGIMTSLLGRVTGNGKIQPIPDLSFAVKTTRLQDMLSRLPVLDAEHTDLPHRQDGLDGLAQRIQQSVLIVAAH